MSKTKKTTGKRQRPAIIALVYTTESKDRGTKIVIEITLKTKTEERRVHALVDSGAKANCVQRKLALEIDLPVLANGTTPLASPKKRKIYLYRDHLLRVSITDTLKERRDADVRLVSCEFNLSGVDVILGYPWLTQVDPLISFKDKT